MHCVSSLDGFDERFFVYMEDVDLAYRSRQFGHPSYFLADVTVYHTGNVSSDQARGNRLFYLLRGRTEYARKHWPRWQAPFLGILTIVIELPVRWLTSPSVTASRAANRTACTCPQTRLPRPSGR